MEHKSIESYRAPLGCGIEAAHLHVDRETNHCTGAGEMAKFLITGSYGIQVEAANEVDALQIAKKAPLQWAAYAYKVEDLSKCEMGLWDVPPELRHRV